MKNNLSLQEEKRKDTERAERGAREKFRYIYLAGRLYETQSWEKKTYVYSA